MALTCGVCFRFCANVTREICNVRFRNRQATLTDHAIEQKLGGLRGMELRALAERQRGRVEASDYGARSAPCRARQWPSHHYCGSTSSAGHMPVGSWRLAAAYLDPSCCPRPVMESCRGAFYSYPAQSLQWLFCSGKIYHRETSIWRRLTKFALLKRLVSLGLVFGSSWLRSLGTAWRDLQSQLLFYRHSYTKPNEVMRFF